MISIGRGWGAVILDQTHPDDSSESLQQTNSYLESNPY